MKNFNRVMSKFNKVVLDLENIAKVKEKKVEDSQLKIDKLQFKIKDFSEEKRASLEVAAKLKNIFTASVKVNKK